MLVVRLICSTLYYINGEINYSHLEGLLYKYLECW